jgi:hypothetical protein
VIGCEIILGDFDQIKKEAKGRRGLRVFFGADDVAIGDLKSRNKNLAISRQRAFHHRQQI